MKAVFVRKVKMGANLRVWWLGGVHLVDTDDELLDTEGEGEESVLTGLAVLGDTGLELTNTGGDDQDGAIGLGGTSDHVLDEITVAGGVNDRDVVLKLILDKVLELGFRQRPKR